MKRVLGSLLLAAAGSGLTSAAFAGTIQQTVPPTYANTPGTGVFIGPHTTGQRTYQLLIHSSLLTNFVGRDLTGLSWRTPPSATAPWPVESASYANYDIYLSGSVDPANRSLTFANNIVGAQTLVRSGPLEVDGGAYPSGGSPNAFGSEIAFDEGWTYTGGNLLVELRHTGNDDSTRNVDALITSTAGYGTLFSGAWQSSYTATSGMQGNFAIIQLSAVPEPASLASMALGLLAMRRR